MRIDPETLKELGFDQHLDGGCRYWNWTIGEYIDINHYTTLEQLIEEVVKVSKKIGVREFKESINYPTTNPGM